MLSSLDFPKVAWSSWNSQYSLSHGFSHLSGRAVPGTAEALEGFLSWCHRRILPLAAGTAGEGRCSPPAGRPALRSGSACLQRPRLLPPRLRSTPAAAARQRKHLSRFHPDELLSAWPTWSVTSSVSHNSLSLHRQKHADYLLMNIYAIVPNNG